MKSIEESNYSVAGELLLPAGLWLSQLILAGLYLASGLAVIFLPEPELAAILPWSGYMPALLLKFIGGVDLAAGLGMLLPSVTRIAPGLTVVTALCSAALQALSILSHALIGTLPAPLLVNLAVLALSLFVAWGRSTRMPIASRGQARRMSDFDVFGGGRPEKPKRRTPSRRRSTTQSQAIPGSTGLQIHRGMRGASFHRAQIQRKFCNE